MQIVFRTEFEREDKHTVSLPCACSLLRLTSFRCFIQGPLINFSQSAAGSFLGPQNALRHYVFQVIFCCVLGYVLQENEAKSYQPIKSQRIWVSLQKCADCLNIQYSLFIESANCYVSSAIISCKFWYLGRVIGGK